MQFMVLRDFPLDEIPFLKGQYQVVSDAGDSEFIYDVDDALKEKLKVLEEAGFIKEIKGEQNNIECTDDIIRLTDRVELVQGGSLYMHVKILGHDFRFTETQLLSPVALSTQLLRLKKLIKPTAKEWKGILEYWFSISVDINEESEDEEYVEKILNYLNDCVIYTDKEMAASPFSLYSNGGDSGKVYCTIDALCEHLETRQRRKLRGVLSDYIEGNSVQWRVRGRRVRFWGFSVDKCGIDLEKQKEKKEDE
ncbi:unnamed protein product [marine sediment metagenome]|uniref:Uncharacterized protein n=2 Tax=marine sediment metagenome TaxID=412755 RepID=X1FWA4_9ZZZZ